MPMANLMEIGPSPRVWGERLGGPTFTISQRMPKPFVFWYLAPELDTAPIKFRNRILYRI